MVSPARSRAALAALALGSSFAALPARALTLEEALARARERAPAVLEARGAVARAGARVTGAEVLGPNPRLEVIAGPRYTTGDQWIPQVVAALEQPFELGDGRSARIASAHAAADGATADLEARLRGVEAEAARLFLRALAAQGEREAHRQAREIGEAFLAIGRARAEAGDLGALDVRRLALAAARARADERAAEAEQEERAGELRVLLALDPAAPLALEGDLEGLARAALPDVAPDRPELRALRARIAEADADRRAADARAVPDLTFGLGYSLEEGDHMALVVLGLTLPFFDHGQGARAEAAARAEAGEAVLASLAPGIEARIAAARAAHAAALAALEESGTALEIASELDDLERRRWEAGEAGVTELLATTREILEARRDHLAHARDAALARVALVLALGAEP
jgi:cobalt-zinc-cadmium efflux system outer membrane protein